MSDYPDYPSVAATPYPYDMLTLIRLVMASGNKASILPTITGVSGKYSPDLLLELYEKYAKGIQQAPVYPQDGLEYKQLLCDRLREAYVARFNLSIPGTLGVSKVNNFIPLTVAGDPLASDTVYMASAVDTAYAREVPAVELRTRTLPLPKHAKRNVKSVAGHTANWLSALNRFLLQKNYKRMPDVRTGEMRILAWEIRKNQRNPHLYPSVSLLCTANISMVLDIYVNTERLDVFNYARQLPNQPSIPRSLIDSPFAGVVTVNEFGQYVMGLGLAQLTIRISINSSVAKARKTKIMSESR